MYWWYILVMEVLCHILALWEVKSFNGPKND